MPTLGDEEISSGDFGGLDGCREEVVEYLPLVVEAYRAEAGRDMRHQPDSSSIVCGSWTWASAFNLCLCDMGTGLQP